MDSVWVPQLAFTPTTLRTWITLKHYLLFIKARITLIQRPLFLEVGGEGHNTNLSGRQEVSGGRDLWMPRGL